MQHDIDTSENGPGKGHPIGKEWCSERALTQNPTNCLHLPGLPMLIPSSPRGTPANGTQPVTLNMLHLVAPRMGGKAIAAAEKEEKILARGTSPNHLGGFTANGVMLGWAVRIKSMGDRR